MTAMAGCIDTKLCSTVLRVIRYLLMRLQMHDDVSSGKPILVYRKSLHFLSSVC